MESTLICQTCYWRIDDVYWDTQVPLDPEVIRKHCVDKVREQLSKTERLRLLLRGKASMSSLVSVTVGQATRATSAGERFYHHRLVIIAAPEISKLVAVDRGFFDIVLGRGGFPFPAPNLARTAWPEQGRNTCRKLTDYLAEVLEGVRGVGESVGASGLRDLEERLDTFCCKLGEERLARGNLYTGEERVDAPDMI